MVTSKLTCKGQVTVPKSVRDSLGLRAGDKLEFVNDDGRISIRRAPPLENPFLKYRGMFKGVFKSREEINAWIAEMRDPE